MSSLCWYWWDCTSTRLRLCVGVRARVPSSSPSSSQRLLCMHRARARPVSDDVSKIKKTKTGICFCLSPLSYALALGGGVRVSWISLAASSSWRSTNVSTTKLIWCAASPPPQPFLFPVSRVSRSPLLLNVEPRLRDWLLVWRCLLFCGDCSHQRRDRCTTYCLYRTPTQI